MITLSVEREKERRKERRKERERVKERPCRGARLVNELSIDLPAQSR